MSKSPQAQAKLCHLALARPQVRPPRFRKLLNGCFRLEPSLPFQQPVSQQVPQFEARFGHHVTFTVALPGFARIACPRCADSEPDQILAKRCATCCSELLEVFWRKAKLVLLVLPSRRHAGICSDFRRVAPVAFHLHVDM
jgi:hypothetical protein